MTSPGPGWYPDPASPQNVRWWDGAAWTAHSQPNPRLAAAPAVIEPPAVGATAAVEAAIETAQTGAATQVLEHEAAVGTPEVATPAAQPAVAPEAVIPATADVQAEAHDPLLLSAQPVKAGRFDLKNIELGDIPKNMLFGGVALLLGAVGLFLPWMTSAFGSAGAFDASLPWKFTGGDLTTGVTGIIGHGFIYVVLFGAALAALAGRLPNRKLATMGIGGAITILTAVNYLEFSASTGDVAGAGLGISIGFGLYAMLLAGLGLVVTGLVTEEQ
ncbi:MAG: DUF2510 domain-containing protein [Actinomycetota bacterium]|nr:DUF2510 domain-containing protein [Actinomycetota bacterium]